MQDESFTNNNNNNTNKFKNSLLNECFHQVSVMFNNNDPTKINSTNIPVEMAESLVENLARRFVLNDNSISKLSSFTNSTGVTNLNLKNFSGGLDLSPIAVYNAIKQCTSLEVLNLEGRQIDSSIVDILCSEPHKSKLRVLILKSCNISNTDIKKIISNCTRLECIDLSGTDITQVFGEDILSSSSTSTLMMTSQDNTNINNNDIDLSSTTKMVVNEGLSSPVVETTATLSTNSHKRKRDQEIFISSSSESPHISKDTTDYYQEAAVTATIISMDLNESFKNNRNNNNQPLEMTSSPSQHQPLLEVIPACCSCYKIDNNTTTTSISSTISPVVKKRKKAVGQCNKCSHNHDQDLEVDDSTSSITLGDIIQQQEQQPVTQQQPQYQHIPRVINKRFNLSKLYISGCKGLNDDAVKNIALLYPLLQEFDCSYSSDISDISPIITECKYIRYLDISGCNITCKINNTTPTTSTESELIIGDSSSKMILSENKNQQQQHQYLRYLQVLKYSGSGVIDTEFINWFTYCKKKLIHLELRNKAQSNVHILTQIIKDCEKIQVLDLYGVNIDLSLLESIIQNQQIRKSIKLLDISNCGPFNITNSTDLFIKFSKINGGYPSLQSLAFSKDIGCDRESLKNLGNNCPNLSRLVISGVKHGLLNQRDIIQSLQGFNNLRKLEIWCCEYITLSLTGFIAKICPKIEEVKLCAVSQNGKNPERPSLTLYELAMLQKTYPNVQFKLWQHSIRGNRYFQLTKSLKQKINEIPIPINTLKMEFDCIEQDEDAEQLQQKEVRPKIYIDNIPIWCNEQPVHMKHLIETTQYNFGAIPIVEDWCCNCNIDEFNGVLFYGDDQYVYWEIHEPGPSRILKFSREQYTKTILAADGAYKELLSTPTQQEADEDMMDFDDDDEEEELDD